MRMNGIRETLLSGLEKRGKQPQARSAGPNKRTGAALVLLHNQRLKARKVTEFLASGEKLPRLQYLNDHLERLRDWNYTLLEQHMEQLWSLQTARLNSHSELQAFEKVFLRAASAEGIPLYARTYGTVSVEIVHAQWQDRLDENDWWLIGNIGLNAARAADLSVQWGGKPVHGVGMVGPNPAHWSV